MLVLVGARISHVEAVLLLLVVPCSFEAFGGLALPKSKGLAFWAELP